MIQISIINQATNVDDVAGAAFVAAAQIQVTRDFYPVWGSNATLAYVPKGGTPAPNTWWLTLLDNADQAGALGYHELTDAGQAVGKVFVQTTMDEGDNWTVTASHELLEMIEDPYASMATSLDATRGVVWVAWEVCDACEDDQYAYQINGVSMSDFVFPTWFQPWQKNVQFDFMKHITTPLQLLPGGYISEMTTHSGSWKQIQGDQTPRHQYQPAKGSRRDRRTNVQRRYSTFRHP